MPNCYPIFPLFQAEQRLTEEHNRVEKYLHDSTLNTLMKACETVSVNFLNFYYIFDKI